MDVPLIYVNFSKKFKNISENSENSLLVPLKKTLDFTKTEYIPRRVLRKFLICSSGGKRDKSMIFRSYILHDHNILANLHFTTISPKYSYSYQNLVNFLTKSVNELLEHQTSERIGKKILAQLFIVLKF